MGDMFWDCIKGCQKDEQRRKEEFEAAKAERRRQYEEQMKKEYEMHARSNESMRDKMDGVLEENPNAHSCESCNDCKCKE